jgi:hypothetical protein
VSNTFAMARTRRGVGYSSGSISRAHHTTPTAARAALSAAFPPGAARGAATAPPDAAGPSPPGAAAAAGAPPSPPAEDDDFDSLMRLVSDPGVGTDGEGVLDSGDFRWVDWWRRARGHCKGRNPPPTARTPPARPPPARGAPHTPRWPGAALGPSLAPAALLLGSPLPRAARAPTQPTTNRPRAPARSLLQELDDDLAPPDVPPAAATGASGRAHGAEPTAQPLQQGHSWCAR